MVLEPLQMALAYAARSWHVFPVHSWVDEHCSCGAECASPAKHPRTPNGLKDASTDPTTITKWWQRWPSANVGLATGEVSGLVVLDVDGAKGEATLTGHEARHGALPATVRAITGGDGMHYLFGWPGHAVKNSAGKLGPGLDTRGDGGYIVVPPSVHRSGSPYEWIELDCDLAPMPGWMLDALTKEPEVVRPAVAPGPPPSPGQGGSMYGLEALAAELDALRNAGEGQRNHTLNEAAFNLGQLVAGGELEEVLVRGELERMARMVGLAEAEISATVSSGLAAGCASPRRAPERSSLPVRPGGDGGQPDDAGGISAGDNEDRITDGANARRLVATHGKDLRYCRPWGTWLVWDGRRWKRDETGEVYRRAKDVIARLFLMAALVGDADARKRLMKAAMETERVQRLEGMVRWAESDAAVVVTPDQLDASPWLLNVMNGTLDLRSGELRPHDRKDRLTKLAPVAWDGTATAPVFTGFLERILPSAELVAFVQRIVGYTLTGDVSEQVLFFLHGAGANGKSTLLTVLQTMLGEYASPTEPDLFMVRKGEAHPTGVADLMGVRMAVAVEVEQGKRMAENQVKQLTGGDRVKARFMRQDFFDFKPSHKLFFAANHKPQIRGTDHAIWRRIRLVPFNVTVPDAEQDKHLVERLEGELAGILRWAVEGCLAWRRQGLGTAPEVVDATAAYRAEEDTMGRFIDERLVVAADREITSAALRMIYVEWCEANGERPASQKYIGQLLAERGFERVQRGRAKAWTWLGLGQRTDHDGEEEPPAEPIQEPLGGDPLAWEEPI